MAATGGVFISYRRQISAGHAGRLSDSLALAVGKNFVFMDSAVIQPGTHFPDALRQALGSCRAVAVLIGPGWSTVADARGPRLSQPDDWVRLEIESALGRGLRVVPVLVGGAAMPTAEDLPDSLRALAALQAIDMRDASWDDDVRRLLAAIGIAPAVKRSWFKWLVLPLVVAIGGVSIVMTQMGNGSRTVPASEEDPFPRLVSLHPTQPEQEALVQRFAGASLSVPVLRTFLADATATNIAPKDLHAALERFASRYFSLIRTNGVDGTPDSGIPTRKPDLARQAIGLIKVGQFDQAHDLLEVAAKLPAKASADDRTYAAWALWLTGQLDALRGRGQSALERYDQAAKIDLTKSAFLRLQIIESAARQAGDLGDLAAMADRFQQALRPAAAVGKHEETRLLIEWAAALDRLDRKDEASIARERAERIFALNPDPGNATARKNAQLLVPELERRGRVADARALRDLYGI